MLVSGPAGATDTVLWTLLLRDRPAQPRAVKAGCQSCARPGVPGFRAFFRALLRVAFARGPLLLDFSTTRAILSSGSTCAPPSVCARAYCFARVSTSQIGRAHV